MEWGTESTREDLPRPRGAPGPPFSLLPPSRYPNTYKELPAPLPPYLLLLEWLSTAGLFFSTTLAEDFLFLPSPNSPSGPLRRPPPPWVAQNGERGAAQDGGSASLCSSRFRFLFSGRLINLGEPVLEVGWGASCSRGRKAGRLWLGLGRARCRGEGKAESKMVVLGT